MKLLWTAVRAMCRSVLLLQRVNSLTGEFKQERRTVLSAEWDCMRQNFSVLGEKEGMPWHEGGSLNPFLKRSIRGSTRRLILMCSAAQCQTSPWACWYCFISSFALLFCCVHLLFTHSITGIHSRSYNRSLGPGLKKQSFFFFLSM